MMAMNSIKLLRKYGYTRDSMRLLLTRQFSISNTITTNCLGNYFVHYYTGEHFKQRITGDAVIIKDNIAYNIKYLGCTSQEARNSSKLKLSFRRPKYDFHLPAIVLVVIDNDDTLLASLAE